MSQIVQLDHASHIHEYDVGFQLLIRPSPAGGLPVAFRLLGEEGRSVRWSGKRPFHRNRVLLKCRLGVAWSGQFVEVVGQP